jgi:hypothetical protein
LLKKSIKEINENHKKHNKQTSGDVHHLSIVFMVKENKNKAKQRT